MSDDIENGTILVTCILIGKKYWNWNSSPALLNPNSAIVSLYDIGHSWNNMSNDN